VSAPLLLLLLAAAADPCAPVERTGGGPGDPEAYLAIGAEELAAGSLHTAAFAFREALRRSPDDPRAVAGLSLACGRTTPEALIAQATHLVEASDCRGALAMIAAARALRPDPASSLLEAVCHVRVGADERAEPLLREALADEEAAAAARLLLGLVARRSSDDRAAREWLREAAASADPRVASAARRLLPAAGPDERILVSLYSGATWDSNALLAPDGVALPEGRPDGAGAGAVTLVARPFGRSGPFVRAGVDHRRHARFSPYDILGWSAAGGWTVQRRRDSVLLEYAHRSLAMGGAPYLDGDAVSARGDREVGPVWLTGRYDWRQDRYAPEYARRFSGDRHALDLRVVLAGPRRWVSAGYRGERALAGGALSYVEHGPAVQVGVMGSRGGRLWLEGVFSSRSYDERDPDLDRRLTQDGFEARDGAEVVLWGGLAAHASGGAALVTANAGQLSHRKLTASLGVSWGTAWP
jgi:tetratricopeptide (TPR) repeat protein